MLFKNQQKDFLIPIWLAVFCQLILGLLYLINSGLYWDDWTLHSKEAIFIQFNENGAPLTGYFHFYLSQLPSRTFWYRLILFFSELGVIWVLYKFVKELSCQYRIIGAIGILLFVTVPMNAAKVTLIMVPASFYVFLFFWASWLLYQSSKNSKWKYRFLAEICFILSFTLNSLLVFYAIPFSMVFFRNTSISSIPSLFNSVKQKIIFSRLVKHIDLILLPVLFWVSKQSLFPTKDVHQLLGYNKIRLERFFTLPKALIRAEYENVIRIFDFSNYSIFHTSTLLGLLVLIVLFTIVAFFLRRKAIPSLADSTIYVLFFFSFLSFAFGATAYLVVGQMPRFWGYDTRHQILLSLGITFFIMALVLYIKPYKLRVLSLSIITSVFLLKSIDLRLEYLRGWIKQEALLEYFKDNRDFFTVNTWFLEDYAKNWNATEKDLVFYNLNGIAKLAFGEEKMLISERGEINYDSKKLKVILSNADVYNMKNYTPSEPELNMIVKKKDNDSLGCFKVIYFAILYHFDKASFEEGVSELLEIRVEPLLSSNVNK